MTTTKGKTVDNPSVLADLLETWRATADWVKAVIVVAVPGYVAFLAWLHVSHRRAVLAAAPPVVDEARMRDIAHDEAWKAIAEWEMAELKAADRGR